MPFRRIIPNELASHPDLVERIAEELIAERPDGPPDAPEIIEEQVPRGRNIYVTVIWDAWDRIDKQERGRVIMDAYQKVRGAEQTLNISAALGLTHQEANRLGIENTVLPV